ncbi:hypothetical protein AVEN_27642-1 [Araneus ventricosus]|uniref:Uncharacterized protein n=1 Tax=Araneus ventricosus TaxID=182803 RepID=A0A4Y2PFF8_ARAVE|nr:hypothetical protein AVEN_27642-1 [Araneus ventricosus]
MTRTTPELAPPSPNFHATPTGGHLDTTYDLMCNRRIYSGIGFRTWNPPALPLDQRCLEIELNSDDIINVSRFYPQISTQRHDLTSWMSFASVYEFIDARYWKTLSGNEL